VTYVVAGIRRPLCALLLLAAPAVAQDAQVLPVRGDIYMISSAGANTVVQAGRDGILVVDPSSAAASKAVLAEIRRLSERPVRLVVNTTADADHVGGNQAIASSGQTLQGGNTRAATVFSSGGAPIWAHEGVLNLLTDAGGEAAGWPTDTYFVGQKDLFFNGEPVQLLHVPAAHSDGDSFVMFRRSDVIAAGDVYTPDRYPVFSVERGGINGVIAGLNHLLRLTVPEFNQQGGTLVVPGHGRLSDEADVSDYRDMVTIVRDRIQDLVKKKMTLEQVQAAKPTFDYDGIYGAKEGAAFVERVYRSLTKGDQR
jgi:glyoxylase-like metal-dependent hydrolase (beta-lactamase superfamily II)